MTPTAPFERDMSNGWEEVAKDFSAIRERSDIGVDVLHAWAQSLPHGGAVLDLGCGTGIPVARALLAEGFEIHGVDAAPAMVAEFRQRFPNASVACEPVEHSTFFGRRFDGIVAIGLIFLLPSAVQRQLILAVASALNGGGHFLFTAPAQACEWADTMTGRTSHSLGEQAYARLLAEAGLVLVRNYVDAGGNHYFHAQRP